ncbi:MAG: DeoR/GlpR transcriptional regulator [Epulopiscium sp.]|nr:DeoR/GlpR transcriptional regulator [Candidatus Epulonipiscium sp.]
MLAIERRKKIIDILNETKSVKVQDLSELFGVTEETIRRDLEKLEKEGLLQRTYGGAILLDSLSEDLPFTVRAVSNPEGKRAIGKVIANYIEDNDTIMLDSSSTALEVAKNLKHKKNITVITNSVIVLTELAQNENCTVISTGGMLRARSMSFVGPGAKQAIENYYVNKAILSCKGIHMQNGIMESNEMETEIKKSMVKSAHTIFYAIDHTKFDQLSFVKMLDIESVDYIFTDKELSKDWEQFLLNKNVKWEYCNNE